MKKTTVTLHKEFKRGLPGYSNITVGATVSYEIGENEEFNWEEGWDEVNRQLSVQSDNLDQSWITNSDHKNHTKVTVITKK
jgi:hypothetical protein